MLPARCTGVEILTEVTVLWTDLRGADAALAGRLAARALPARRERAAQLRQPADRLRSLAAGALLQQAMNRAGLPGEARALTVSPLGQPLLARTDTPFHFSLSHSGDIALCAYSCAPLGADVEEPRHPALQIAARKFASGESRWVFAQPDPEAAFFRLWVLKESYVKALGVGLSLPLRDYEMRFGAAVQVFREGRAEPWAFHEARPGGYPAAVCAASDSRCRWVCVPAAQL